MKVILKDRLVILKKLNKDLEEVVSNCHATDKDEDKRYFGISKDLYAFSLAYEKELDEFLSQPGKLDYKTFTDRFSKQDEQFHKLLQGYSFFSSRFYSTSSKE